MSKSIKVKGAIKVDKNGLDKIKAGSCAHMGKECHKDIVLAPVPVMMTIAAVDRLYI